MLLAIFASNLAIAQASTAVIELQKILSPVKSMQADFKQTVFNENNSVLQTASGNMSYKKPNLFKWRVEEPDPTLLVTNGKTLWNYDAALEQVIVQKYTINKEVSPLSFILDEQDRMQANFNVEQQADGCFKLTPLVDNSNFVNVSVCFTGKDAIAKIKSVRIVDHLGQTSVFEFSNMKTNIALSDLSFNFSPPPGVDVIGDQ